MTVYLCCLFRCYGDQKIKEYTSTNKRVFTYVQQVMKNLAESKLGLNFKASIPEQDQCLPKVLPSIVSK